MTNLMNSEIELSAFFEQSPDLVCIAGRDGFFKSVNEVVIKKMGYTIDELLSQPISTFIHEDDKKITHKHRSALLSGKVLHNFVNRYISKKGDIIWLEWTSLYFSKSGLVFATAKDITERKLAETDIEQQYNKFKNLTAHFKSDIEKDRKYLTYELHEELAQLTAAIKMNIESVAMNTPLLPEPSKVAVEKALVISQMLIKTLQRISFSISPNVLHEFGLNAALEWLSTEFSLLHNIPCTFNNNYSEELLTKEIQTDFFRICQESLKNVQDHANAKSVHIRIEEVNDKIRLSIKDDGDGFDITQQKETPGFVSMRERVNSINGELLIESEPETGTGIFVTIAK
ncbi:PAS domain S-box protein [Ferruginibacter paludis]|uniref:PAS domain-containing sensor histidine kinase n=1 Tax=Ferruginibacter paludis TaxID=1310417 RepID=UPI0025B3E8D0|nr:PAS domain S-box protein [Ferruginibacter paludis]MDN3654342.1 PAS domain S-box protein [Ferruginibacter paludis]